MAHLLRFEDDQILSRLRESVPDRCAIVLESPKGVASAKGGSHKRGSENRGTRSGGNRSMVKLLRHALSWML